MNMTTRRTGTLNILLLVVSLAGGCATVATDERPTISGTWVVAVDDSCGKLAGFLAMADLFDIEIDPAPGEPDLRAQIEAEMAKRCPDDVEPEALGIAFDFPTIACADLRGLVAMADAFGMMATLPRDQRKVADKLIDNLDAEIEKRCPALD